MVLCLHQLGHLNVLLNAVLLESLLEDLVVLNKLILMLSTPLDL